VILPYAGVCEPKFSLSEINPFYLSLHLRFFFQRTQPKTEEFTFKNLILVQSTVYTYMKFAQ
jgi:hypothetical protein